MLFCPLSEKSNWLQKSNKKQQLHVNIVFPPTIERESLYTSTFQSDKGELHVLVVFKIMKSTLIGEKNVFRIHFVKHFEIVYKLKLKFLNCNIFLEFNRKVSQSDNISGLHACEDKLQAIVPTIVSRMDTNLKTRSGHVMCYMPTNQSLPWKN